MAPRKNKQELKKMDEVKESKENVSLSKVKKSLDEKIAAIVEKNGICKVAIYTHPSPDPDAIGSQMSLAWLLKKSYDNIVVDCFYDGFISHPQNQRMVNLLDPDLKEISDCQETYDICISVDTIPVHSVSPENTNFDLVIDHHKEAPNGNFKGFYLNLKAGSCCATIYQLINYYGAKFEEDNDNDAKIATALLVGIITDTEYKTSDDTTDFEHIAYAELFPFRNSSLLKQITKYKQPREWVQARACVAQAAQDRIKDGILIHGVGFISYNNRDLIAAVADEMLSWEGVETSVAFAVVDGCRVEASIRSSNASLAVPNLCKDLGTEVGGEGGGKLGKGSFRYNLDSFKIQNGEDEDLKNKLWEFIECKEFKRILKNIRGE